MKCDGNKPCATCTAQGVTICAYSEGKVVRDRQQLESLKRKVDVYEDLLRSISRTSNIAMPGHTLDDPMVRSGFRAALPWLSRRGN